MRDEIEKQVDGILNEYAPNKPYDRRWKFILNIKKILNRYTFEHDYEEIPSSLVDEMVRELKRIPGVADMPEIQLITDMFEKKVTNVEEFDRVLSYLYDFADEHGIWLGL